MPKIIKDEFINNVPKTLQYNYRKNIKKVIKTNTPKNFCYMERKFTVFKLGI